MLGLADENANGAISWPEFIPIGIEAIKTFLARNKIMLKMSPEQAEINEETMRCLMMPDVEMKAKSIIRSMKDIDCDPETKEHSGKINFQDMKKIFLNTSHLCIKEVNLLLRGYVLKYGYEEIVYTDFVEDLFRIRFDLLRSRLMDINVMNWSKDFFLNSGMELINERYMRLQDVRECLANSKQLTLQSLQITILIGHATIRDDQTIDVC